MRTDLTHLIKSISSTPASIDDDKKRWKEKEEEGEKVVEEIANVDFAITIEGVNEAEVQAVRNPK